MASGKRSEAAEPIRPKKGTSRRQHMSDCDICIGGGWDGYAEVSSIRDVFTCGKGWIFESLWEDMEEYAFERLTTASTCFAKLSAAAKVFTLERWREWKGLTDK